MIIFINAYQHHDPALLQPIANEAARRRWHVTGAVENLPAFTQISGPKAVVQAAEFENREHGVGQYVTQLCRQHNIPTVGIQHGFPLSFHDADKQRGKSTSDLYCLWGEYWRDWFNAQDYAVTGAPHLDVDINEDVAAKFKRSLHEMYTAGLDVPLGLLCPQLHAYKDNAWLMSRTMEERADEFIELVERVPFDGFWLVRPHPSDWKYTDRMVQHRRIATAIGGGMQMPHDIDLLDILPAVDVVAGMSTVLLEGMIYGASPFPIGVDYLPDDMWAAYPQLLTNGQSEKTAAANVCDAIERLVNERA